MSTDAGQPLRGAVYHDIQHVPALMGLQVRRRDFDPPRRVTTRGVDRFVTRAIEFEVAISEPFPIRAAAPALWVGDEPLTSAETAGELIYRFFSFEPRKLRAGAPISLGWNTRGGPRQQTNYRFAMPAAPPRKPAPRRRSARKRPSSRRRRPNK